MAWVKMKANLLDSAEVEMISAATNLDRFEVVGRLQYLWGWVFQYTKDGTTILDRAAVDRKVCHQGFADAMVAVEWLADGERGLVFVNWTKHNTTDAALKDKWATKKRVQRESPKCPPDVPGDKVEQTKTKTKTKTKSNTPPTPQGAKAWGGDSKLTQEEVERRASLIVNAWPWIDVLAAEKLARFNLSPAQMNKLDKGLAACNPPPRDRAGYLINHAKEMAGDRRQTHVHRQGSSGVVEDRAAANVGTGSAGIVGGAA